MTGQDSKFRIERDYFRCLSPIPRTGRMVILCHTCNQPSEYDECVHCLIKREKEEAKPKSITCTTCGAVVDKDDVCYNCFGC